MARETASEVLPELVHLTPWFELFRAFERAYDASPRNESLIRRIYRYADWCTTAPQGDAAADDLFSCTCVCFYEHIPQHPAARDDMLRWFAYQDFIGSEQIFRRNLTKEEFLALKEHFYRNRKNYVERPSHDAPTV